jgi:hypothetical protein
MIELEHQFTSDGLNFEASTYYHALITEILLWTYILLISKKKHIYEEYLEKIQKKLIVAKEFVKRVMRDDGSLFQIGDNDGGSFIVYKNYGDTQDKSFIIELFDHISYKKESEILKSFSMKKVNIKEEINSFFDNYYGILHTHEKYKLFLRSGEKGQQGKGGHAHCDINSICIDIADKAFIVDPGTFTYTGNAQLRNLYRSSYLHNSILIKDEEQYEIRSETADDLFWLYGKVRIQRQILNSDHFIGFHDAYGVEHKRRIKCSESNIEITDELPVRGFKYLLLHFSPDVDFIETFEHHIKIYFQDYEIFIKFPEDNIKIKEYDYSPTYSLKQNAKKLIYKTKADTIEWKIFINENTGTHR